MKTIAFSLALALTLPVGISFAQQDLTAFQKRAIAQMSQSPETLTRLQTRGEEALLDSTVCEVFDGTEWSPEEKTWFRYDEEGLLTLDSAAAWNASEGWQPYHQAFYTYTASGDLKTTSSIGYDSLNSEWMQDTLRLRNEYDNGRLAAVWTETYDPASGMWFTDFVDSLIYDAEGQVIRRIGYISDGVFTIPFARMFLGYENGLLDTDLFQISWDGGANWMNFFRTFYYYENGLLDSKRIDYFDESTSNFFEADLETFQYDGEEKLVHTENFYWSDEWTLYRRCDYYYGSGIPSGSSDIPMQMADLQMANPFAGGWILAPLLEPADTYEIAVFNASGQAVFQQRLAGNAWQLPALSGSGLHILTVRKNSRLVASKKIVVAY